VQNVAGGTEHYLQGVQAAASSPDPACAQLHALFDYVRRPLWIFRGRTKPRLVPAWPRLA